MWQKQHWLVETTGPHFRRCLSDIYSLVPTQVYFVINIFVSRSILTGHPDIKRLRFAFSFLYSVLVSWTGDLCRDWNWSTFWTVFSGMRKEKVEGARVSLVPYFSYYILWVVRRMQRSTERVDTGYHVSSTLIKPVIVIVKFVDETLLYTLERRK